jgi:two-component system cell cycle sensor histidine kinase/response regulator CckA
MRATLLLVDDEPAMRSTLRRLLKHSGYGVREAADGIEALDVWREHRQEIALVIADVRMPNMGGPELFARLRAERPDVRLVLMTADDDGRASHSGHVLRKPFSVEQLVGLVERVLAES